MGRQEDVDWAQGSPTRGTFNSESVSRLRSMSAATPSRNHVGASVRSY